MKSPRTYRSTKRGFIALTSVLIMSAMLMVLMFSSSASGFYARFDALNSEFKRVSTGLSEACANAALLKIAQNYDYVPPAGGETVPVGSDTCRIVAVSYSNHVYDAFGKEMRKTATATTSALYPPQNGSWSTHKIVATVTNPSYAPSTPPPTCSFTASPLSILSGQSVTLQWLTAGNATNFKIDRDMGGVVTKIYTNSGASGSWSDYPSASATYTATITGPGGSTQCVSPQSVTVQPSISCADTVVMLSGGMSSGDLANEGDAVKTLLDLYGVVVPVPHVGIGSYGGLDGSPAQVPAAGRLTGTYGINGSRVIGPKFPTLATSPNQWTTPNNAFSNDTAFATDAVSGDKQGYARFGFNVPPGTAITGIQVAVDGLASVNPANTGNLIPSGVGNYDQWRAQPNPDNATKRVNAVSTNDGASSYIDSTTNNKAETYVVPGSGVPAGSTITAVTLRVVASEASAGATIRLRVENGTGAGMQSDGADQSLTMTYQPYTRAMPTNPLTSSAWTVAEVNSWTTRFGVVRTNATGGTPRVTQLYVTVDYTPPITGSLGVELSANGGSSWTGVKTATFNDTESEITLGNAGDMWGKSWTASDFADGNFVLRVTNNFSTGLVSLNYVTARVYYGTASTGLYQTTDTITNTINSSGGTDLSAAIATARTELDSSRHQTPGFKRVMIVVSDGKPNLPSGSVDKEGLALDATDVAKQDFIASDDPNIQVFTVHYGSPSGRDLVAQLATGVTANGTHQPGSFNNAGNSTAQADVDAENNDSDNFFIAPDTADMVTIFDKIGKKVCPAAVPPPPPVPPPSPPSPPTPSEPVLIGSWDEIITVSP